MTRTAAKRARPTTAYAVFHHGRPCIRWMERTKRAAKAIIERELPAPDESYDVRRVRVVEVRK